MVIQTVRNQDVRNILVYLSLQSTDNGYGTQVVSSQFSEDYFAKGTYVYALLESGLWKTAFVDTLSTDSEGNTIALLTDESGNELQVPTENVLNAAEVNTAAEITRILTDKFSNEEGLLTPDARNILNDRYSGADFLYLADWKNRTYASEEDARISGLWSKDAALLLLQELAAVDNSEEYDYNRSVAQELLASEIGFYTSEYFIGKPTTSAEV